MFFDTHAHYDDKRFNDDRDKILQQMNNAGVDYILNAGADMPSSRRAVVLAKKYPFIYCSVGVHPHDAGEMTENDLQELKSLTEMDKVVAIGEIGLDYFRDLSPRDLQKHWFKMQMDLAAELELPVIIHNRDAYHDCMEILKRYNLKKTGGVMHCFSGNGVTVKEVLKLGMYISFAGPITYKNAHNLVEAAKEVPLDRILIETDCPYLSPEPNRGQRNSSLFIHFVAEKLAEIKGTTVEEIAKQTMQNAFDLFKIR